MKVVVVVKVFETVNFHMFGSSQVTRPTPIPPNSSHFRHSRHANLYFHLPPSVKLHHPRLVE